MGMTPGRQRREAFQSTGLFRHYERTEMKIKLPRGQQSNVERSPCLQGVGVNGGSSVGSQRAFLKRVSTDCHVGAVTNTVVGQAL